MPWDDQVFLGLIEEAARRAGKSRTQVLVEAGYARSLFNQKPGIHGRGIAIIERLMPALGWTHADALRVVAKSFGWGDVPICRAQMEGRGSLFEAISEAALRLRGAMKADEDSISLDTALALVGELVRARTGRGEGSKTKD